jgi:hypothetical protein
LGLPGVFARDGAHRTLLCFYVFAAVSMFLPPDQ